MSLVEQVVHVPFRLVDDIFPLHAQNGKQLGLVVAHVGNPSNAGRTLGATFAQDPLKGVPQGDAILASLGLLHQVSVEHTVEELSRKLCPPITLPTTVPSFLPAFDERQEDNDLVSFPSFAEILLAQVRAKGFPAAFVILDFE